MYHHFRRIANFSYIVQSNAVQTHTQCRHRVTLKGLASLQIEKPTHSPRSLTTNDDDPADVEESIDGPSEH